MQFFLQNVLPLNKSKENIFIDEKKYNLLEILIVNELQPTLVIPNSMGQSKSFCNNQSSIIL